LPSDYATNAHIIKWKRKKGHKTRRSQHPRSLKVYMGGRKNAPELVGAPEQFRTHAEIHDETSDGRGLRSASEKPVRPRHSDVRERRELATVEHPFATNCCDLLRTRGVLEAGLRWNGGGGGSFACSPPIGAVGGVGRDDCDVGRENVPLYVVVQVIVFGGGARLVGAPAVARLCGD
jgi:hypothetical protein